MTRSTDEDEACIALPHGDATTADATADATTADATSADPADAALLSRARRGDRDALEHLLRRHEARVYRFGLKVCGDREDARDVAQETLFAMARGVSELREAASMSTWLYTVVRSFCIKHRGRRRHAPRRDSLEPVTSALPDDGESPEEVAAGRELEQALGAVIASLAPTYREVLLLRDVEELPASEVAALLGIGVDAVKSRLHRARVAVRASLAARE